MTALTQELLKRILSYNPDTGQFTRLVRVNRNNVVGEIVGGIRSAGGYARVTVCGKQYQAGRLAFFYMMGRFPTEIDHINNDRSGGGK